MRLALMCPNPAQLGRGVLGVCSPRGAAPCARQCLAGLCGPGCSACVVIPCCVGCTCCISIGRRRVMTTPQLHSVAPRSIRSLRRLPYRLLQLLSPPGGTAAQDDCNGCHLDGDWLALLVISFQGIMGNSQATAFEAILETHPALFSGRAGFCTPLQTYQMTSWLFLAGIDNNCSQMPPLMRSPYSCTVGTLPVMSTD